jgi:isoquinoline 1-oxidoreductase alpha subunit
MPQKLVLKVNGSDRDVVAEPSDSLLWVLREQLQLTGAKFGCGAAYCGACTVRVDDMAVRSCIRPVGDVVGKRIQTIEGLAPGAEVLRDESALESKTSDERMALLHPLQQAWIEHNVPQCGYCQPGQLMAAAALCDALKRTPTDAEIDAAMAGNLCRCGTYPRIRRAIKAAKIAP